MYAIENATAVSVIVTVASATGVAMTGASAVMAAPAARALLLMLAYAWFPCSV